MTYKMLFPVRDGLYPRGILTKRRMFCLRWPSLLNDDDDDAGFEYEYLYRPAVMIIPRSQPKYERRIYNSTQLASHFPYWGVRVQLIYDEAENPAPITMLDRWAER